MLKTNKEKLVMQAIQGEVNHPSDIITETRDGKMNIIPCTDGITYNVQLGDSAYGWVADHIEPSVSISNPKKEEQAGLVRLSCVGNKAIVMEGDAKGAEGFVAGKHGGAWNIVTQFSNEDMENLNYGDKILIKSVGQGLKLLDYPEITIMNLDPDLLDRLGIEEKNGKIVVPVTATIPSFLFGSGCGCGPGQIGDVDFMTGDKEILKKYKLDKIRLGDFVIMEGIDQSFGTGRMEGAVSVGVVIHGDSFIGGHGPGITPIMTCQKDLIEGRYDESANLIKYI